MSTNRIFLIIVIILLFILVILTITFFTPNIEKKPFVPFTYNGGTKIVNNSFLPYADTLVMASLKVLDFNPKVILIKSLSSGPSTENFDGEVLAHVLQQNSTYILYIDEMSKRQAFTTISHEMIHIKDMEEGILEQKRYEIRYKDRIYDKRNIPEYSFRPWEIKAQEEGEKLKKALYKALYK